MERHIINMEALVNDKKKDERAKDEIEKAVELIMRRGGTVDPFVTEYFEDSVLYNSLPSEIKDNEELLSQYFENTSKFSSIIHQERKKIWQGDASGLFAESRKIEKSFHGDGRTRLEQEGFIINIEYLQAIGIDPSLVLFFRVTQPSEIPNPEYYWTSDYFETQRGLSAEIPFEQRSKSVTLVADLETINKNGGLIQDINDDAGLALRQVGSGPFDQKKCIAIIKKD